MTSVHPGGARPQGLAPTPDQLEDGLVLARRMVLAIAEALAGVGGEAVPAWAAPDLVAAGCDTIASMAAGLAGELRGEVLR
jgi:hypothetical protein